MFSRVVVLITFACLPSLASAGEEQACIYESANGYVPYSPSEAHQSSDRQRGVSYDRAEIERNNIVYPLDVFVGYAPDPQKPKHYCMRFEIHNPGPRVVEGVRWPFAKLKFGKITEYGGIDDRRAVIENPYSDPEPFLFDSEIRIFENEPDSITSYMPAIREAAPPIKNAAALESKKFTIQHLDQTIADSIVNVSQKYPERSVSAYQGVALPNTKFQPASLSRKLYTGNLLLTATSRVEPTADGRVLVTNEIEIEGGEEYHEIAAPYLVTLFEFKANDAKTYSNEYADALDYFENVRTKWITVLRGKPFEISAVYDRSSGWLNNLAIVDHPIAVETDLGIDCMLVPAYAPAPIAFSLDDCPEGK